MLNMLFTKKSKQTHERKKEWAISFALAMHCKGFPTMITGISCKSLVTLKNACFFLIEISIFRIKSIGFSYRDCRISMWIPVNIYTLQSCHGWKKTWQEKQTGTRIRRISVLSCSDNRLSSILRKLSLWLSDAIKVYHIWNHSVGWSFCLKRTKEKLCRYHFLLVRGLAWFIGFRGQW